MAKADVWSALFWLAVGAFVAWKGYDLGLGKPSDPGSGFALFWIGLAMAALAVCVSAAGLRREAPTLAALWRGTLWPRVLLTCVLLLVYAAVFETIGFPIATTALLLALMLLVDRVRLWLAVPIAVVAPLAVFLLITRVLKITLPGGLLAPWLS
jgi:putative tricarboxylic transport membrane protein